MSEARAGSAHRVLQATPWSGRQVCDRADFWASDRVLLDPSHVPLRAGHANAVTVYVRDADVVVHAVDAETGAALVTESCLLESPCGEHRAARK